MNVDGMADEQGLGLTTAFPPPLSDEELAKMRCLPVVALVAAAPRTSQPALVFRLRHPRSRTPSTENPYVISSFALSVEAAKLLAAELENAIRLLEMKKK